MISTSNPATLALLATLTIALGFENGLTGLVYVRLVDANGEVVTSDLLGYAAEIGDEAAIFFPNTVGDFKDEAARAADVLLALDAPAVRVRVAELAYYAADDIRARNAYLAS
jgi:hypothetical protein